MTTFATAPATAPAGITPEAVAAGFLHALRRARTQAVPFRHWLLTDALPDPAARAIADLPFRPAAIGDTMGRRETHNASRIFFSPANQAAYPVCAGVAAAFQSRAMINALERTIETDLSGSFLRIEYCQDTDGFWLEPHTDIGAKLFTMLVYLSDRPEAESWGTDIYDTALTHLGSAPGGFNKGLIFIPGTDTWHGVEKRSFAGIRKSIIVNYVKPEWRSRHELAFPDHPLP